VLLKPHEIGARGSRLLHRDIARLRAAEDLVDQLGPAFEEVWDICAVGH